MNKTKLYNVGTIIFREGDPGECMYDIETGKVGVYHDYGGPNEKLIAELYGGKVFGEMGLVDHAPRSATVVVLGENTVITTITEEDFFDYYKENPAKVMDIVQQMCHRLRKTTNDYIEACHTVYDAVETKKKGEKKSRSLLDRIDELCNFYSRAGYHQDF
ncbi:MAG: cyclic nucleotide-binding domain-containing protein [Oscillospiraceae bacterium]|nr:cyclic nucleotide-binding domain-containing protein [Oscillospiraceae bacterium]